MPELVQDQHAAKDLADNIGAKTNHSPEQVEALRRFGLELAYRRKLDIRYKRAADFAAVLNVTPQYLSQIEAASPRGGRGPVMPSDQLLEKISKALDWPILDMYLRLGKIKEQDIFGEESGWDEVNDLQALLVLGSGQTSLSGRIPVSRSEWLRQCRRIVNRLRDRIENEGLPLPS